MNPLENSVLGKALSGLSTSSMMKVGMKYWWLALPVGLAAWWRYKERKSKGEVSLYTVMTDTGMLIAPVAAIIMINETMAQNQAAAPAAAAVPTPPPSPISGPIKEAVFTAVQTAEHSGIGPR